MLDNDGIEEVYTAENNFYSCAVCGKKITCTSLLCAEHYNEFGNGGDYPEWLIFIVDKERERRNNNRKDDYHRMESFDKLSEDIPTTAIVETISMEDKVIDIVNINKFAEENLTYKEKEVLSMLIDGYKPGFIAKELEIHPNTVTNIKNRIKQKIVKNNQAFAL